MGRCNSIVHGRCWIGTSFRSVAHLCRTATTRTGAATATSPTTSPRSYGTSAARKRRRLHAYAATADTSWPSAADAGTSAAASDPTVPAAAASTAATTTTTTASAAAAAAATATTTFQYAPTSGQLDPSSATASATEYDGT